MSSWDGEFDTPWEGPIEADRAVQVFDHVACVVPKGEPIRWAKQAGNFVIGASLRWSGFGLGFEILDKGILFQVGPAYLFVTGRLLPRIRGEIQAAIACGAPSGDQFQGSNSSIRLIL